MKRRIITSILAFAIVLSLSVTALASSDSRYGSTSGGTSGSTSTSALLSVNRDAATAKTSAGTSDGLSLATTVNFYFTNTNGQTQTSSNSGSTSVVAGTTNSKGLRATSQHSVNGGSRWGNWSCSLSASA